MNQRRYSILDQVLTQVERGLHTLLATKQPARTNPALSVHELILSDRERQHSARLMRVNHCGEVCAQALYYGQMLTARENDTRQLLKQAAAEETDHLAWTRERLQELQSHTSYLNGLWYLNSFLLGALVGIAGDRWSLGFVEETEAQVSQHLTKHLGELPAHDHKSQAIVTKMQEDEEQHGRQAAAAGANTLPSIIKKIMQLQAKVMTTVAYWI